MVMFQVTTDSSGDLTVSVQADGPQHPDLLDEMAARCAWLFREAYAALPEADDDDS